MANIGGAAHRNEGLASFVIAAKRAKYGRNELEKEQRENICKVFAMQFMSLVAGLLLLACVASFAFRIFIVMCAAWLLFFPFTLKRGWSF